MFATPALFIASAVTLGVAFLGYVFWDLFNTKPGVCVCGHGQHDHLRAGFGECTGCKCRSFHKWYDKP